MGPDHATLTDECALIERELGVLLRRRLWVLALDSPAQGPVEGPALAILRRLDESGPMRLTTLAGLLRHDASTVSRQVAALDKQGLVERQPDPDDRRAHLLALSATGRRHLEQARAARSEALRRLMSDWPGDDRGALGRLLARLNRELDRLAPTMAARGYAAEYDVRPCSPSDLPETA